MIVCQTGWIHIFQEYENMFSTVMTVSNLLYSHILRHESKSD